MKYIPEYGVLIETYKGFKIYEMFRNQTTDHYLAESEDKLEYRHNDLSVLKSRLESLVKL